MPGPNPTNNYIGSFQFRVTIEGINDPLDGFVKVSALTSTTENISFKHGLVPAEDRHTGPENRLRKVNWSNW